jgi:proline dehydrogenase
VATVDVLGESAQSEHDAAEKLEPYKRVIEALKMNDLKSGLSIKLPALGLTFDEDLYRRNLEKIVVYDGERGRFVRVDMKDSSYMTAIPELVLDMHERHENVEAVVQAYLRHSLNDIMRLAEAGVSARLCKATMTGHVRSPTKTSIPSGKTTYSCWKSSSKAVRTWAPPPTMSTWCSTPCASYTR